jgi:uncharacterized membrane protein YgcG
MMIWLPLCRSFVVLIVAVALGWLVSTVVSAQDIPQLQGQVTDLTRAQVLAGDRARIVGELDRLQRSQDIQLFALFVESTGGRTATDYASEVARLNSLGGNDALLVVALADRTDALWRGSRSLDRLTDRELEQVLSRRVEPLLAQANFAGAVVAASRGLGEAAGPGETQVQQPGSPGDTGVNLRPLITIGLIGLGGFWLWNAISRRRQQRQAAEAQGRQMEQLAHEANSLLISTDEALRAADQEVAFAVAQFGEEEVAPYRAAVAQASIELKAAFGLRQQLDDEVPEDAGTRNQILSEMIERTRRAQALLDEQRQRIEELRDLERNAPQILAALPAQIDTIAARLPKAQHTLSGLQQYAEGTWGSVQGNVPEAEKRLNSARDEVEAGQQELEADQASGAAQHARSAQRALTEATQLIDAIDTVARSVQQAQQAVDPQLATARADIATARAALAESAASDAIGQLAAAEQALQQAERELADHQPDILAAHRLATQAETIADEIVAGVREQEAQRTREREILAAQLQVAEATYFQASDYITARHGGIGRAARTRLAEAERHLGRAQALVDTDVRAALTEARRAEQLAEEAYALAQADFDAYDRYGTDIFSGGRRSGGMVIPFPIPTGGGWGGAGWGGSPWGSFGGDGGGGEAIGGGWSAGGGGAVGGRW